MSSKFNFLKKKIVFLIAILVILLAILALFISYPFYPPNIEKEIISVFNETGEFSGDGKTVNLNRFNSFTDNKKWSIVLTKFDILSPVYSILIEQKSWTDCYVFYFRRDNIFSNEFYLQNPPQNNGKGGRLFVSIDINNKSFEEAVKFAKENNLAEYNKTTSDITTFPSTPPSSQPAPSGFRDPRENLSPKEQVKVFLTFIKEHWNEEGTQSMLKKDYGKTFSSFEEFRNDPKVIEQYGTVEELGI